MLNVECSTRTNGLVIAMFKTQRELEARESRVQLRKRELEIRYPEPGTLKHPEDAAEVETEDSTE